MKIVDIFDSPERVPPPEIESVERLGSCHNHNSFRVSVASPDIDNWPEDKFLGLYYKLGELPDGPHDHDGDMQGFEFHVQATEQGIQTMRVWFVPKHGQPDHYSTANVDLLWDATPPKITYFDQLPNDASQIAIEGEDQPPRAPQELAYQFKVQGHGRDSWTEWVNLDHAAIFQSDPDGKLRTAYSELVSEKARKTRQFNLLPGEYMVSARVKESPLAPGCNISEPSRPVKVIVP